MHRLRQASPDRGADTMAARQGSGNVRLNRRLVRLEKRWAIIGPCRECGGLGRVVLVIGDQMNEQPNTPCSACGSLHLIQVQFVSTKAEATAC